MRRGDNPAKYVQPGARVTIGRRDLTTGEYRTATRLAMIAGLSTILERPHMRTSVIGLILLSSILWSSAAFTAASVTITALEAPVWVQRDGTRSRISGADEIRIDDRLITGDSGRLALHLDSGIDLQLDANSEIEITGSVETETAITGSQSSARFHGGRTCVQFHAQPEAARQFNLRFGDAIIMIIHEKGHVCAEYSSDLSRIALVSGTVQITNTIESSMVVLGEPGSEYRFDDTGFFELGRMEAEIRIEVDDDTTAVREANSDSGTSGSRTQAVASPDPGTEQADTARQSPPATGDIASAFVYTVYLFSTRSEEVANEVNQKLRDAGHQTLILSSDDRGSTRYRIAVSGFSSRQAARDYSAAIVGKHGIADTWIGRSKITE